MKTGFIVGKFYPFHMGHMYLLDVATANCDQLIVWVCEKADQHVLGHVRAKWIQEMYPSASVRLVPDTLADDDTEGWARYTVRVLGKAPDIVFTSEDYGEPYARAMGSEHMLVDKHRTRIPISGTIVRSDPKASWKYLAPSVRAYYTKRIVILGAESTGTTTLSKALAQYYNTTWVEEYGREYSVGRDPSWSWNSDEFIHIAKEQSRREDEAARNSSGVLICDTDPFATTVWHRRYMGDERPFIEEMAKYRNYDLYILTGDEIPFVQDGLRDGEHIRHEMHQWFLDKLENTGKKYIVVSGSHEDRMKKAIDAIDSIIDNKITT